MDKKYPIRKSTRLREYDYSNSGYYFITICEEHKREALSTIENTILTLNEYGKIVENNWLQLVNRYTNLGLDSYVIMPNHFHGILILENDKNVKPVSSTSIVGAFKSLTTIAIHKAGLKEFKWQRSFYDRIIRDEKELFQIRKYIEQNPFRWDIEKDNPNNIDLM